MEEGRKSRRGGVSNLENAFAPEGMNSMCKRGIEEQPEQAVGAGWWWQAAETLEVQELFALLLGQNTQ